MDGVDSLSAVQFCECFFEAFWDLQSVPIKIDITIPLKFHSFFFLCKDQAFAYLFSIFDFYSVVRWKGKIHLIKTSC